MTDSLSPINPQVNPEILKLQSLKKSKAQGLEGDDNFDLMLVGQDVQILQDPRDQSEKVKDFKEKIYTNKKINNTDENQFLLKTSLDETSQKNNSTASPKILRSAENNTSNTGITSDITPMVQQMELSVNKNPNFVGLKPWSKEWVFQGEEGAPSEVKPLFSPKLNAIQDRPLFPTQKIENFGPGHIHSYSLPEESVTGILASLQGDLEKVRGNLEVLKSNESGTENQNFLQSVPLAPLVPTASGPLASDYYFSGTDYVNTLKNRDPSKIKSRLARAEPSKMISQEEMTPKTLSPKTLSPGYALGYKGIENNQPIHEVFNEDSVLKLRAPQDLRNFEPQASLEKQVPVASPPSLMTGRVVPGAMSRDRLTTETLLGLSQEINRMTLSGGNGEIRVRLKPENLGELQLIVGTRGRNVLLKVRASDEGARRILEESLGYLKESLAEHHLNLAKVDLGLSSFATARSKDAQEDFGQNSNFGWNPNSYQNLNNTREQRRERESQYYESGDPDYSSRGLSTFKKDPNPYANAQGNGHIDVMA